MTTKNSLRRVLALVWEKYINGNTRTSEGEINLDVMVETIAKLWLPIQDEVIKQYGIDKVYPVHEIFSVECWNPDERSNYLLRARWNHTDVEIEVHRCMRFENWMAETPGRTWDYFSDFVKFPSKDLPEKWIEKVRNMIAEMVGNN